MLREKSLVMGAILLMAMLLYAEASQVRLPADSWHRGVEADQGCPTCHQMGPVLQRT